MILFYFWIFEMSLQIANVDNLEDHQGAGVEFDLGLELDSLLFIQNIVENILKISVFE